MKNYNLERFKLAQNECFDQAYKEICNGRKESHWMWFIFPQLKGLGISYTSIYYGIFGMEEAKAYLDDDYLRKNLIKITKELLKINGKTTEEILGPIDEMKLKSCMTLFDLVSDNPIFSDVLEKYYKGERCQFTLDNIYKIN